MQITSENILFVSKTFCRHLQDMSSRRLQDMPSRRLQYVFSVTIFRLPIRRQDVFKTFLQDVCKTSWKMKNCYAEDVLKTSCRPTNVCWAVIPVHVVELLEHVLTMLKENVG